MRGPRAARRCSSCRPRSGCVLLARPADRRRCSEHGALRPRRRRDARPRDILRLFAIGLPGFSVYLFTLRGFYALKDTRTPFLREPGRERRSTSCSPSRWSAAVGHRAGPGLRDRLPRRRGARRWSLLAPPGRPALDARGRAPRIGRIAGRRRGHGRWCVWAVVAPSVGDRSGRRSRGRRRRRRRAGASTSACSCCCGPRTSAGSTRRLPAGRTAPAPTVAPSRLP